jgi:hypothetical protein
MYNKVPATRNFNKTLTFRAIEDSKRGCIFVENNKTNIKNSIMDYQTLTNHPPKLVIKADAREVIFTIISCMCNNKHTLKLSKNADGDFRLNGMGFSLSNYQMRFTPQEIEWKADEKDWREVIRMINTGTSVIATVVSR